MYALIEHTVMQKYIDAVTVTIHWAVIGAAILVVRQSFTVIIINYGDSVVWRACKCVPHHVVSDFKY